MAAQSPVLDLPAGGYDLSFEANGIYDDQIGSYSVSRPERWPRINRHQSSSVHDFV